MTRSELMSKTTLEIKQLLVSFNISESGALEKRDLIDRLIQSGQLRIFEDAANSSSDMYSSSSDSYGSSSTSSSTNFGDGICINTAENTH